MLSPFTFHLSAFHYRAKRGFTLIEIIVSLGIFAVVAVVALGALVRIITANNKAQTIQSAITNLNFSLDAMSREMRVGSDYYCSPAASVVAGSLPDVPQPCTPGMNRLIAFKSSKTATDYDADPGGGVLCRLIDAYRFVVDPADASLYMLEKAAQSSCNQPLGDADFAPVVSDEVSITGYSVAVYYGSNQPFPLAYVRISGYAGVKEKEKTYFDVQTAISERTP